MIKSFRHKGLEKLFAAGKAAGIRPEHAKRLTLLLASLNAAQKATDMAIPGRRFHSLKGDWRGYFALNVSGNWRLVFRFEDGDAFDVDYLDYH